MRSRPATFQLNLEGIQSDLVDNLSRMLILLGGCSMWLLTPGGQFRLMDMTFAAAILFIGILSLSKREKPRLARYIYVIGINLLLLMAMWIYLENWVPFLAPLVIVISIILAPRFNWLFVAIILGVLTWLTLSGFRSYPLIIVIPTIFVSGWIAQMTI